MLCWNAGQFSKRGTRRVDEEEAWAWTETSYWTRIVGFHTVFPTQRPMDDSLNQIKLSNYSTYCHDPLSLNRMMKPVHLCVWDLVRVRWERWVHLVLTPQIKSSSCMLRWTPVHFFWNTHSPYMRGIGAHIYSNPWKTRIVSFMRQSIWIGLVLCHSI